MPCCLCLEQQLRNPKNWRRICRGILVCVVRILITSITGALFCKTIAAMATTALRACRSAIAPANPIPNPRPGREKGGYNAGAALSRPSPSPPQGSRCHRVGAAGNTASRSRPKWRQFRALHSQNDSKFTTNSKSTSLSGATLLEFLEQSERRYATQLFSLEFLSELVVWKLSPLRRFCDHQKRAFSDLRFDGSAGCKPSGCAGATC